MTMTARLDEGLHALVAAHLADEGDTADRFRTRGCRTGTAAQRQRLLGLGKLALEAAANAGLVVAILLAVGLEVVVPEVRNVLQEQHHEDVILVLSGIDCATEGVASSPGGIIDLVLGNLIGHQAISF